ncbi:MAG: hypothetical protein IIB27_02230 [Chloroflexi bacterium]|nr:hypothetical protein [Chloroflexota bacterium]
MMGTKTIELPLMPRRVLSALTLLGLFLVATACGLEPAPSDSGGAPTPIPSTATPEPTPEIPDGWNRTQVRAGFLGRYTNTPLIGFTIDLPPGWIVGESWPWHGEDVINGWIAAPPTTSQRSWSTLTYHIGFKPESAAQALTEDPRYVITQTEVLGVKMAVRVAAPDAEKGNNFAAYYERIPGAPDGVIAPRLDMQWSSSDFGFDHPELLTRVLRSVRYAELPSLPDIPVPVVVASGDWVRKIAGSDGGEADVYLGGSFSLLLPPGWTTTERQGVDGVIGAISGDGIELFYYNPMGLSAGGPSSGGPDQPPQHVAWEEQVDGLVISLVRPASPIPDQLAKTGVTIWPFIDGGGSHPYGESFQMSVSVRGLDGDQQETLLAILRTINARPEVAKPAYRPVPN